MIALLILLPAGVLVALLIRFDVEDDLTGILLTKPVASGLFILAAYIQPHPMPAFAGLVLAGLCCCLVGDICLAFNADAPFLAGLVAFLLGHVCYTAAFFQAADISVAAVAWAAAALAAGLVCYRWLQPHLGPMQRPVIAYIVVISLMVVGAGTILADSRLAATGRLLVLAGALSFYVSDLFVARQRFVTSSPANRQIGLPLYYLGQFLIAFSVGRLAMGG